jgi:hypothetical protein
MADSSKPVSRSTGSKGRKRSRIQSVEIDRRFHAAVTHGQFVADKWSRLLSEAWTDKDDMACLVEVERDTLDRGMPELERVSWERLAVLRQKVLRRDEDEHLLGELDSDDPDFLIATAALAMFEQVMARRFPEHEKPLQALRRD